MPLEHYTFPAPLTQAIVDYLAGRPWREVNGLLQAIHAEVQSQEAPPPADPTQAHPIP